MSTAKNTAKLKVLLTAVSILALTSIAIPGQAGNLIGGAVGAVGGTVQGAVGAVSGAVGSVSGTGGTYGGTGGTYGGTGGLFGGTGSTVQGTIGVLTHKSVLTATVKSDLIGGIKAKLHVLSKKNLAKLCVGIGGGSGCGSGHSRHQLLGLIDARLSLLSHKQLLALCVSVGGNGCGGGAGGLHSTIAKIGVLDRKGVLHGTVKSNLIGGIKAKLDVLSKKNLAKLCVGIGGGSGCGSGHSRHQLLGLIDYRLTLLSKKQLLGLCVSVGGTGCGSKLADGGGGSGGGGGGNGGNGGNSGDGISQELAGLTAGERRELKRKCPSVLDNPVAYNRDAVRVCRVLAQLAGN